MSFFSLENFPKNPTQKKTEFSNMDKTSILDENLTQFWALCGQNRKSGVTSILSDKAVQFNNVRTHVHEVYEPVKDIEALKKELLDLISSKPLGKVLIKNKKSYGIFQNGGEGIFPNSITF